MRAFAQSWLCLLVIIALAVFAFLAGVSLELAARSSVFSLHYYREGIPIPVLTRWFFALHVPGHNSLLIACFYPVLCASAYWLWLLRSTPDLTARHINFILAAIAAFVLVAAFLVAGVLAYALPWLPMCGGMVAPEPSVPPVQRGLFVGLICFLLANIGLLIWSLFLPHNKETKADPA